MCLVRPIFKSDRRKINLRLKHDTRPDMCEAHSNVTSGDHNCRWACYAEQIVDVEQIPWSIFNAHF